MAFHKWDEKYYEKQCQEWIKLCDERFNQICQLQKELRQARDKLKNFEEIVRPVLFIEEGSLMYQESQIDLLFQFTIIWVKRGHNMPQIYEPHKQPLKIAR